MGCGFMLLLMILKLNYNKSSKEKGENLKDNEMSKLLTICI